jgi:hypothetical protein
VGETHHDFRELVGFTHPTEDLLIHAITFKGTGSARATFQPSMYGQLYDREFGAERANHSLIGDLTADLKLLMGIIPNQASTARQLFDMATATYPATEYVRVPGISHMMKDILDTIRKDSRWSKCDPFETRDGIAGLCDRL